jgi:ATP-binding cassette subfamily B protein
MVIERVGQWVGSSASVASMGNEWQPVFTDPAAVGRWIDALAARASFEAEQEPIFYRGFRGAVKKAAPVILRVEDSTQPMFIMVIHCAGKNLVAVDPDLKRVRLNSDDLRDLLFRRQRSAELPEIERLLCHAGVSSRRRRTSMQLLLDERFADLRLPGCWTLRLHAGEPAWRHARDVRLPACFTQLMLSYAAAYVLWLLSWWVLGFSALQGRFDRGWTGVWALLLLTMVPLRLLTTWLQGVAATGAGWLCRQKLLYGSLRLNPDELRSSGIGHFLGRALELEAIETVGFSGGVLGVVALVELAAASLVLGVGASPVLELISLAVWSISVFALLLRYVRRRRQWTGLRLEMTHDLIERIIGHRTRLVQETPARWHAGEDQALERYMLASRSMDRMAALLNAFAARGLVLVSLFALTPAIMNGSAGPTSIAITLGGALIASEAIRKIVSSIMQLADTAIAWQRVRPLMAKDCDSLAAPANVHSIGGTRIENASQKLMELRDVRFQHNGRPQPVLEQCQLSIFERDKLLLEGSSGTGKSTLVALLAGLRAPDSGLLLQNGLDRQTLGVNAWRRKVAAAPQFHENHVFSETFAFNLLMGRRWPASADDMLKAEALCRELGLGDLLDRMPGGLTQMVGETGWQLSHGERSRLFIARALLQNSDMVILDESFAALDPGNLRRCVECVVNYSKTLLVVAHP